ncbi:hypothetical protein [Microcystis aeruginosa]|uniref:hypothetical protein n=1 Tax=Microcystis aeruginosa TaxID=1126 RepID=UPI001257C859|nr:hypothetical protein [Microcystis aeruginosa]GCA90633.1 hypothetical protein MiTa_03993 [Microcystis aeruginosa NIES-4264]
MTEYTIISGNIFEDLGFANAEEKLPSNKVFRFIQHTLFRYISIWSKYLYYTLGAGDAPLPLKNNIIVGANCIRPL